MAPFDLLYTAITIVVVLAVVLGLVAYLILAERKVSAWVQDRLGPNRVGPGGLLQPIADGGKMFLKEDIIPSHVDRWFYLLAPSVALATALLAMAVVPFGSTVAPPTPVEAYQWKDGKLARDAAGQPIPDPNAVRKFDGDEQAYRTHFSFAIAPGLDIGILYVFAIGSLAVYGIILGGWSANSKYSLLGALRSSAQIISYEIPLGMSILGVVLITGSLNLETIIAWQNAEGHFWFVGYQWLAFLLFMTSVFAECNRLPFDLPEAEQELVGGYHTEYSSLKFGMFFLGEYTHMITTSFLMAILFFGGWTLFGLENVLQSNVVANAIIKLVILCGKMGLFIFFFLLVRWTIPRFRFDQLMNLAWKVMIPLSILNLLAVILVKQSGASLWVLTAISALLFVGAGWLSLVRSGTVTVPKRAVRKLPPGMPAGVR